MECGFDCQPRIQQKGVSAHKAENATAVVRLMNRNEKKAHNIENHANQQWLVLET